MGFHGVESMVNGLVLLMVNNDYESMVLNLMVLNSVGYWLKMVNNWNHVGKTMS